MEKNEDIKVATQGLQKISKDKVAQRIAELRFKALLDEIDNRLTGERIGREKASKEYEEKIAELKEKSSKEFEEKIAKQVHKMLKLNIPIKQISEITGLSEQEIEKIYNTK